MDSPAVIMPPPETRTIVDKTAQFIARNGPEFEKRVIAANAGNDKFKFLNCSDPYNTYYQHQVAEARAQNQAHPPDIRTLVDKTAQFIGKHGAEFEKRVIAANAGNDKFKFFDSSDPYNAYYQRQVAKGRAQNQAPA